MAMTIEVSELKAKPSSDTTEFKPLPDNVYYGHITDVQEPITDLKTKYGTVDILKLEVTIKDDKDGFNGRKVWPSVFVTKEDSDGNEPEPSANLRLYHFLEAAGYPLEKKEQTIGDVKKDCIVLPTSHDEIDSDHLVGKPVKITTKTREWEKDGETKSASDVKYWDTWKDGTPLTTDDLLPF